MLFECSSHRIFYDFEKMHKIVKKYNKKNTYFIFSLDEMFLIWYNKLNIFIKL